MSLRSRPTWPAGCLKIKTAVEGPFDSGLKQYLTRKVPADNTNTTRRVRLPMENNPSSQNLFSAVQEECGWSQSGFPVSAGGALRLFLVGSLGARASLFCWAAFAVASSGRMVCSTKVEGGESDLILSDMVTAFFDSDVVRRDSSVLEPESESWLPAISWRSASSQISVSRPSGLPECCQISRARWEISPCEGELVFMVREVFSQRETMRWNFCCEMRTDFNQPSS